MVDTDIDHKDTAYSCMTTTVWLYTQGYIQGLYTQIPNIIEEEVLPL